jgi:TolB-like protein/Flp pilus assembly protein TadD
VITAKGKRSYVYDSKPSIAVLPFRNRSEDSDQEYLAEGVAEEILTGLARVRWLRVASRISSFSQGPSENSRARMAQDMGVRYLLEGSVRRAGQRVRIAVQLTDAEQDQQIWAERYDREAANVFELQDEITATILGAIEPELGEAEQERARRAPPDNLDAWDLYLRGQWHLYRFRAQDNEVAREYFQRAIETDPNFAASYTGLAYACHLAVIEAFSGKIEELIETGIGAARRAVVLDEKDAMAFSVLARTLTDGRQFGSALSAGSKGIELNPNVAQVHFGYAFALVFSGNGSEALKELDRCAQLSPRDPNSWSFMTLRSWALCLLQRVEEAIECARRAAEEPRSILWPNLVLAAAYGHLGQSDEAQIRLQKFYQENPGLDPEKIWLRLPFKDSRDAQFFVDGIQEATRSGS